MKRDAARLTWSEETRRIGGVELVVAKAGQGKPLLVLHEELGHPGALGWEGELAATRTLIMPFHPGFGRSPRCEWVASVRDLAAFYAAFVREEHGSPIDAVGISLGGWIAAEMLASDPHLFAKLAIVAAPGIRPPQGEIYDLFRVPAKTYLQATVLDPSKTPEFASLYGGEQTPEQFEAWEEARAEIARLAWSPYLFDPSLPNRLALVTPPPVLIVWGKQDAIVPFSVAGAYAASLRGAQLLSLDRCGHRPEIEKRDEFTSALRVFLGG